MNSSLELTLLGTAAAEAWPAPSCRCDACTAARRLGGPNIRTRPGALLDNDFKIDFGPDTIMQVLRAGRDLADLRTIVFTHQHSDHIVPSELGWFAPPFTNTPPAQPIAVYGNSVVVEMIQGQFSDPGKHNLVLHKLEPFQPVTTPTEDTILPLPADHVQGALTLRITRQGKTIFYGHDSGLYPTETRDALAEGPPLDLAVFDCTNGGQVTRNRGHMGIDGVLQMIEEFRTRGIVTPATTLVATHFSHNGGLMHEDLVSAFAPHGVRVAYDGVVYRV